MQKIPLVLVVAAGENGVIGRDNAMPWRLKSDLQHFRRVTMGKPVVMGRKTYLSIGKPLVGRTCIVVSRDPGCEIAGVVVAASLDAALDVARADALRRGADAIMVIGGGDIFRQTMAAADRLLVTVVHARPQGDVFFPPISPQEWRETERREHAQGPGDDATFTIVDYARADDARRRAGDEVR